MVRRLSSLDVGAFVVSSMVGAGVFTLPVVVLQSAGGAPGALGAWLLGGLLACCGALAYAELATRMPEAGGEYRYLQRAFGSRWGFLSGWTSFVVGFGAALAASALGLSAYLANLVGVPWVSGDGTAPVLAAGVIVVAAAVHAVGLRLSGAVQLALAGGVLIGILALIVVGFTVGEARADRLLSSAGIGASWWVALLQVGFAYTGWNAAAYLAGEVRDPRRSLPRALVGGSLLVLALYVGLNAMFLAVAPPETWRGGIAIGHRIGELLGGPAGARATDVLIALAMAGSISAMTVAGPRVYWAMARDGLAPRGWGSLPESGGCPRHALGAQTLFAAVLALSGGFEPLLVYAGSTLLIFSAAAVASTIALRRAHGAPAGYRMPLYPLPAVLFVGFAAWTWIMSLIERPLPTLAGLLTLAVGAVVFAFLTPALRHPEAAMSPRP